MEPKSLVEAEDRRVPPPPVPLPRSSKSESKIIAHHKEVQRRHDLELYSFHRRLPNLLTGSHPRQRSRLISSSSSAKEIEENLPKCKPFKICGVKERTRIGVVAATLEELRAKIQTKIPSIGDDFKIVLEEDCTRVEDEDYFKTLSDFTVLMAVSVGEQWTKASSSLEEKLSMGVSEVDGKMTEEETSQRLAQVAGRIAENPAVLAFLPQVDLEIMADADLNSLQVLLHQTKDNAEFIQDACERRLLDKIASDEATGLLKLYHRAKTGEVESPKRMTRSASKKLKETL